MHSFELSNSQRKYFGLRLIDDTLDKVFLDDNVAAYFEGNKIVKILNYKLLSGKGYSEYDTNIKTVDREILLPQTTRGREQKLTVTRLLKIRGCGVQFSGTVIGGGINVFDNNRNISFIQSYCEDGPVESYTDIDSWVNKYIEESPGDYFQWLKRELEEKRKIQNAKEGDIVAFKVGRFEYGFARILFPIFSSDNPWIHPRSLTVAAYAFISDSLNINLDKLILKKTLPTIYMFDNDVYYGEMPIVGNRNKDARDLSIPLPDKMSTSFTIPYTKRDILNFITDNGAS